MLLVTVKLEPGAATGLPRLIQLGEARLVVYCNWYPTLGKVGQLNAVDAAPKIQAAHDQGVGIRGIDPAE